MRKVIFGIRISAIVDLGTNILQVRNIATLILLSRKRLLATKIISTNNDAIILHTFSKRVRFGMINRASMNREKQFSKRTETGRKSNPYSVTHSPFIRMNGFNNVMACARISFTQSE